jgi:hypothetical protein
MSVESTNDPISQALNRLAFAKAERERYKASDMKRRQELARIENDRALRRDELLAEAARVLEWRDGFLRAPRTRRIWDLLGDDARLPIFVGEYWDGRLSVDPQVACTAVVMTGGLHQFRLESWGREERKSRGPRLTQPGEIVAAFHPDMLLEFRLHLDARGYEKIVAEYVEAEVARYPAPGAARQTA